MPRDIKFGGMMKEISFQFLCKFENLYTFPSKFYTPLHCQHVAYPSDSCIIHA